MHLWTFQSAELEELLEKQPVFYADWKFTPVNWRPAYEWMAAEMKLNGIALQGHAPVWAWHSCSAWYAGPTIGTALDLLTDYQLLSGMILLEMNVPDDLCLLSFYTGFIDLLDEVLNDSAIQHPNGHHDMFALPLNLKGYDIQAAIPCIRREWVSDIRSIEIKPSQSDYDHSVLL